MQILSKLRFGVSLSLVFLMTVASIVDVEAAAKKPRFKKKSAKSISQVGQVLAATDGCNFFVATNGLPTNSGSVSSPWDIKTALNHPASVTPGSVICFRQGVYTGQHNSKLRGTPAAPIIVRPASGERVTLDARVPMEFSIGLIPILAINGADAEFRGFEVTDTFPLRETTSRFSNPDDRRVSGVQLLGERTKFINGIVHNNGDGISMWNTAKNAELYGNVVYYNGWDAPDRPHGHGTYNQGSTRISNYASTFADNFDKSTRYYTNDNIFFKNYGMGIHAYGTNQRTDAQTWDGNIVFTNGHFPTRSTSAGPGNNMYIDGSEYGSKDSGAKFANPLGAYNPVITNNYTYAPDGQSFGSNYLGNGRGCFDPVIKNNVFGEWITVLVSCFVDSNVVLNGSFKELIAKPSVAGNISGNKFMASTNCVFTGNAYNWYYPGVVPQEGNLGCNLTNLPAGSNSFTLRTSPVVQASAPQVYKRANKYEQGRGNIAIYNFRKDANVSFGVDDLNLTVGKKYELRDAENFLGSPVQTFTYARGMNLSVAMGAQSVADQVGCSKLSTAHSSREFGAYVVVPEGSLGTPNVLPEYRCGMVPAPVIDSLATYIGNSAANQVALGEPIEIKWSLSGGTAYSIKLFIDGVDQGFVYGLSSKAIRLYTAGNHTVKLVVSNDKATIEKVHNFTAVAAASNTPSNIIAFTFSKATDNSYNACVTPNNTNIAVGVGQSFDLCYITSGYPGQITRMEVYKNGVKDNALSAGSVGHSYSWNGSIASAGCYNYRLTVTYNGIVKVGDIFVSVGGVTCNGITPPPVPPTPVPPTPTTDTTAPLITANFTNGIVVATNNVNINGIASDNVGVTSVRYSVNNGAQVLASGTTNWSLNATNLVSGNNSIVVTAYDLAGNSKSITLTAVYNQPVNPPTITSPKIDNFLVNNQSSVTVSPGQAVTLTWALSGGVPTSASIDQNVGAVTGTSRSINAPNTPGVYTYTLTVSNSAGSVNKQVSITVQSAIVTPPPTGGGNSNAPIINTFTVNGSDRISVPLNSSATLAWNISGASPTSLLIRGGIGSLSPNATNYQTSVGPFRTQGSFVYTLVASNSNGGSSKSVVVNVGAASGNRLPEGSFDGIRTDGTMFGWAQDMDSPDSSVKAMLYTGPAYTSCTTLIGETMANIFRSDVGKYAYEFSIPNTYRDGRERNFCVRLQDNEGSSQKNLSPVNGRVWSGGSVIVTPPPVPTVAAPVINSFSVDNANITTGQSVQFSWSLSGGAPSSLSISPGVGNVSGSSVVYTPASVGQYTYTLTATNVSGSVQKTVTVTVNAPVVVDNPPSITINSPSNNTIVNSASVVVSGVANDDKGVSLVTWSLNGGSSQIVSGTNNWSISVYGLNQGDNTITVTAKDTANNMKSASVVVRYEQPSSGGGGGVVGSKPSIDSFTINGGSSANLGINEQFNMGWSISNGPLTSLSIDQGIGSLTPTAGVGTPYSQAMFGKGAVGTYVYTITATNQYGVTTKSVTLNVTSGGSGGGGSSNTAPVINSFTINGSEQVTVPRGQGFTVSWNIASTTLTSLVVSNTPGSYDIGTVGNTTGVGTTYTQSMWPKNTAGTYTYTITATNAYGTTQKTATLIVQ